MKDDQTPHASHETDARLIVSTASAGIAPQGRRRPWMVWVIVVLTCFPVVGNLLSIVVVKFVTDDNVGAQMYAGWTLKHYLFAYYPTAIIIVGVVLMIRMSRWAFLPFAFVLLRTIYNLVFNMPRMPGSEYMWIAWTPPLIVSGIYALATGYGILLWRREK